MNLRKPAAFAAAVTLSLGLSACGGSQSVAEGCEVARKTVEDASAEFAGLDPNADADANEKAIDKITSSISKAEADVDNADVKDALGDLNAQFDQVDEMLALASEATAGDDEKAKAEAKAKVTAFQEDLITASDRFTELCPSS